MFKMGCSMARRILGPGSAGGGTNQEQSATCFSAPSSSSSGHQDTSSQRQKGGAGLGGGSARAKSTPGGGENNTATGAGSPKQSQPSSELNDFSKLEDDPRLPLNVRQIFKITKSWKAIARTMSKTGTAMFLNLFEQNQDLFYLFDRFQHLKGKELHESMELREHAATVMATLDTSINSLSDYDNFVSYLHSIGQLHRKVPGFKREYFWKIEQPFMKAVKQTLDERCNETIEEIYKIAIKLIIETIADGYGHEPDAADGMENNSSQPGEDDDEGDPSDNNNNRKRRAADNEGSRGQSSAPDNGEGNNNNSTGRNNNNNSGGARGRQAGAQFNAGSRPSGGKQQNQQTSNCNSATQAGPQPTGRPGRLKCGSNCCCCGDRSSNNSNYNKPMVKSEMVSVLRYPSLVAKRELSKIVILTNRARFQWRQRRMATKLTEAAVEAFAANHQEPIEHEEETKETFKSKLEQQQQQQQQQQQADNCRELDPEGAKLILATCELMNTTKNLIDSCESYADQLTGQPSAQRAARKLASWKSLLTNLNSSLLNEKGQSRLQDDNLRAKMNAIKDQQHQQRQQSAARTSTTGTTASVFQGQQQQQEEEAEDNFNDNEQLDLPCEPLPNGKRRMNRTTSQAHKIIFCPMRHSDESILASGHIGTPPADDVEICGAIRRRRQEGDQNGRAEGKSGDNERANVSCMVAGDGFGNDVVANTTTSEPPHVGLGAVVDEMAKRTHEDCSQELEKQIAKIELETATSDDDDDDDDDEKHNRARESLSMACPILGQNSSRASVASNNTRTNDERSSRSTDSMRGSQATNSTTGTQLEQQPPADSSSTTRSANNSSANWSSSSSNSANRPKQSSFCLVGGEQKQQQQQQQQQQAKTAAGELPFSSEHNENLYRVSGDSSGPGQSGVNELSEARPSSIKISVEAAEADEEEEEEETKLEKEDQEEASLARQEPLFVTKSKKRFKLIWTSNGDVGQEEDSAEPVRCQQSQQTLLSTLLARVGASSSNHGNCSNDGGESYRIANNNNDSANASTIIGGINPNTDAAISRTAACLTGGRGSGESGAEFRTVALLHKGEISVENLLHSIERRRDKTYPDGRVSSAGDNDDEDGGGGGDLIEFIRVIILINKLILALASSSIKEASRSGSPSETTFCKTTLVN